MSRLILLLGFLLAGTVLVCGQTLQIQVIGAAGMHATGGNLQMSMTLGEMRIETVQSGSITLTEGFHQPDQPNGTSLQDPLDGIQVDWSIYPNPTLAEVTLKLTIPSAMTLRAEWLDLGGKSLGSPRELSLQAGTQEERWNLDGFADGVYLLAIRDLSNRLLAAIKVEKIH
ncbi:hypothetical protein [Pontibacter sp. G13]|uniref:hypothetical protein n=1 Tax=Pontibacter sp. G13 TaxID=3074898 RepID=UPI00288BF2A3|nr:hypothetical protein [Pontibacter sp. G13]WNJ16998.1 hypothetical protein RJD25_19260 [Pontibacter sp. G13]